MRAIEEVVSMTHASLSLRRHAPLAGFLVLAALWGGSFVAIEVGLHYFPTFLFAALRYTLAGLIVLGYVALQPGRTLPRTRDDYLSITISGVLVIAAYHGFLYAGEKHVPGAIAAIVISLAPILTAGVASIVIPDERVSPVQAGGFALGLLGVVVVANPNPGSIDASLIGSSLVLLGALAFSLGSVLTRPLQPTLGVGAHQAWAMLGGSLILLVASGVAGESPADISWTLAATGSFVYLTLGSAVVGFAIYFALLEDMGPTRLNLVGYLEPVAAVGIAWLALGQVVSPTTLLGFAIIFAGFATIHHQRIVRLVHWTRRWSTSEHQPWSA